MTTQHGQTNAMERVQIEHGSAATAAGPNGPNDTQRNAIHGTQNSNDNNGTIIHNGVLPDDAAMAPAAVAPRVLFMSSGASTPSPMVQRRRSRSQPGTARAEQAGAPYVEPELSYDLAT